MKRNIVVAGLVAVCAVAAIGAQHDASMHGASEHRVIAPDAIKWGPAPPALPPGAEAAVLAGDPAEVGKPFAIRLRFPDGYSVAPHWHPVDEHVVVLEGTLMMGLGEKVDGASMKAMTTGTFGLMPKEQRHYAKAKGKTVIQVNSVGPFEVNYVNPADDPRKKGGTQ
jgi:mannose-6-phosphate isomerase-like protein (cupin superfamily)